MTGPRRGGHQPGEVCPSIDFRATYRDHFTFVWTNLLRLGVRRSAIDDAVQDVFLVVHRRLATFEGRATIRTWLFAIVRRVAAQHRRTHGRADRRVRAFAAEPGGHVEDLLHRRELGWVLIDALTELEEKQRAAVVLHTLGELPGPEVAALLGVKPDTAYSRIKAGRRELRRALARRGVTASADLLERARTSTAPASVDRRRVAVALAMQLGGGSTPAATAGALAKVVATLGGIAAATALALSPPDSSAATPARLEEPRVEVKAPPRIRNVPAIAAVEHASAAPVVVVPEAIARPARQASMHRTPTRTREPEAIDPVLREIALVQRVRAALRRGEPSKALALLDTLDAESSDQLAPERGAYRSIALCRADDRSAGIEAALHAHALSPALAQQVESSCRTPADETDSSAGGHE